MNKEAVIQKHYSRLADDYDEFLYYSPQFVRALTEKMLEKLQLKPDDILVDIGCGTGIYALDILKQTTLTNPVIGVDPFAEMLAQIPDDGGMKKVEQGALAFSAQPGTYDKVLIKETIHHVKERRAFFQNIYDRLIPGGRMLLVHVPPKVQYPLFDAALQRCLTWHADPDKLVSTMESVGFTVERDALDYPHVLPKNHYFKMVERCYMSVLTSFTAEELQAGLDEMAERYADQSELQFIDHFDYLTAIKS